MNEVFRQKMFGRIKKVCPVTYEREVKYIMENTVALYQFQNAIETPDQHNERIEEDNHRKIKIFLYMFLGIFGMLAGPIIWIIILNAIPGADSIKGTFLGNLIIAVSAVVFGCIAIIGVVKAINEGYIMRIDNRNFNMYEIRKLADGRLILICGQNFDGQNPMVKDAIMADLYIPFYSIFEVKNIHEFVEGPTRLKLRCDIDYKILKMYNPVYKYFYKPVYDYTIYIQRGLYPANMPRELGCAQNSFEQGAMGTADGYGSIFPVQVDPYLQQLIDSTNANFNLGLTDEDYYEIQCCKNYICNGKANIKTRLTQYLRDAHGNYFSVQFLKGASYPRGGSYKQNMVTEDLGKATNIVWAYYYVKRFKLGFQDYNNLTGGEAKVISYPNITLIKSGGKKSVYTYNEGGKLRKLKILNCFQGLADDVGMR
ncbi:MAG: hypothetical protein E7258_09360 [Lachnospiraceae bacterium]|nr:hypothetical protein [Lachnospiraceae bacterium]